MKKSIILTIAMMLIGASASKAASALQWGNLNATADQGQIAGGQEILAQNGLLLSASSTFSLLLVLSDNNIIDWNTTAQTVGAGETLQAAADLDQRDFGRPTACRAVPRRGDRDGRRSDVRIGQSHRASGVGVADRAAEIGRRIEVAHRQRRGVGRKRVGL